MKTSGKAWARPAGDVDDHVLVVENQVDHRGDLDDVDRFQLDQAG
jgi:hypothetical protein